MGQGKAFYYKRSMRNYILTEQFLFFFKNQIFEQLQCSDVAKTYKLMPAYTVVKLSRN